MSTRRSSKVARFHIQTADYCPFCKYAIGAMMMYFKARNPTELAKYVKSYDVDSSAFDNKFGDIIPEDWQSIPAIVEEDNKGNYKFVGGVYQFVEKYA